MERIRKKGYPVPESADMQVHDIVLSRQFSRDDAYENIREETLNGLENGIPEIPRLYANAL